MEWLFARCARQRVHQSADQDRWRGLALYGLDGSTLRLPDSAENRTHFGGHRNGSSDDPLRNESAYPIVRVVALMALRSHLIADAKFGPYRHQEFTYAKRLMESIPRNSLTILAPVFY
jgi:hypothetical protein